MSDCARAGATAPSRARPQVSLIHMFYDHGFVVCFLSEPSWPARCLRLVTVGGASLFKVLVPPAASHPAPPGATAVFQKNPMGVRADGFVRDGRAVGGLRLLARKFCFPGFCVWLHCPIISGGGTQHSQPAQDRPAPAWRVRVWGRRCNQRSRYSPQKNTALPVDVNLVAAPAQHGRAKIGSRRGIQCH